MANEAKHMTKNIEKTVLSALKYYAIFHYPLNAEEVHGNCGERCSLETVKEILDDLHNRQKVYRHGGFYSTITGIQEITLRRQKGNTLALDQMPKAKKVGNFIYKFPFVRFVGISGSLSKGYADNKSDYDFFIITEKNRLWICRTILHLFKKITFLAGQQHKFCMNYFIDTESLELGEKNQFTAVEMASMIPVSGAELYNEFIDSNPWVRNFFPNGFYRFAETDNVKEKRFAAKSGAEFLLNVLFARSINRFLMKLTDAKWRKKWSKKNYPMEEYDLAFKTTLHVSKNHHRNHQKKVLNRLSNINEYR